MRSTLILEVDDDLSAFIENQQGLVDPSALVNKLVREEIKREGLQPEGARQNKTQPNTVHRALEELVDEDTHAAG